MSTKLKTTMPHITIVAPMYLCPRFDTLIPSGVGVCMANTVRSTAIATKHTCSPMIKVLTVRTLLEVFGSCSV